MGKMGFAACIAIVTVLAAGSAGATTYTGAQSIDGATADLSITTDGTIGVINSNNITAFNINLSDSAGSIDLNNSNSAIYIVGSTLSATSTALNFDFSNSVSGVTLFELGTIGDDGPFYCATNGGCYGESMPAIGLSTQEGESPIEQVGETGVVTLASTASAVPEPASWALMILGIGGIGMAIRQAKRSHGFRFKDAFSA